MSTQRITKALAGCALVTAVLSLVVALVIPGQPGREGSTGLTGPAGSQGTQGPAGPQGIPGSGFQTAFIWGHAVVKDCNSTFTPGSTTFVVHYVNFGNTSATNTLAHYEIKVGSNPTVMLSGAATIGTVPRLSAGNISETVATWAGCYGNPVDVWFTWT